MLVKRIRITNWRNFKSVDVALRERQFVVGPNASGKSNFLDVFRFLRDIAKQEGGGLQKAVKDRGGVPKLRCLAARSDPEIKIDVELSSGADEPTSWRYELSIGQESRGLRRTLLGRERAWRDGELVCDRPNDEDDKDRDRLTQTSLEQINANSEFREIARFFQEVTYLHLVPQLLRYAESLQGSTLESDPFGQGFLERVARTNKKTRDNRLRRIERALEIAVPQLNGLSFTQDPSTGRPHLQARYSHWRPRAGWQQEDQFSDGTLRLIGLLWSLMEGESLLLLEEPELSLHQGIVSELAPIIFRMQTHGKKAPRQVITSTHSEALLSDEGIDGREVLMLTPDPEGTVVNVAADVQEVSTLLGAGLTVAEVVLPRTRPTQLPLFDS